MTAGARGPDVDTAAGNGRRTPDLRALDSSATVLPAGQPGAMRPGLRQPPGERPAPEQPPTERLPAERERYAGLATRVVSFAIDAAVINAVSVVVATGAALIVAVLHLPRSVQAPIAAAGGGVYILWCLGYFVTFWSTTGQTLGARVMRIRVLTADGRRLPPGRALLRCAGVVLAALPLFAGFIRVLFDSRRRAFQDRLARTVVVDAPRPSPAEVRRLRQRSSRA